MSSPLKQNTTTIQELLDTINSLPEASVELPELTNEGTASDLFSGKELIDGEGNKITGTFTIDNELSAQDDLIAQIQSAADRLPSIGDYEPVLQDKTVTPTTSSQTITPDDGYDGLSEVTVEAVDTVAQATPSITVSSSGLITASATQIAGYVNAGTKSATKQLTTQAATTITPNTTEQVVVSAGTYVTGDIVVTAVESGDNSGITDGNMVTVVNGTGTDMTIGLYKLSNGESVQLPCNLSGVGVPVCFVTTLGENTLINSTSSLMPSSAESVDVGFGGGTSVTNITVKTGYLILNASNMGTTLEVSLA